jgi:hypothetical protein
MFVGGRGVREGDERCERMNEDRRPCVFLYSRLRDSFRVEWRRGFDRAYVPFKNVKQLHVRLRQTRHKGAPDTVFLPGQLTIEELSALGVWQKARIIHVLYSVTEVPLSSEDIMCLFVSPMNSHLEFVTRIILYGFSCGLHEHRSNRESTERADQEKCWTPPEV